MHNNAHAHTHARHHTLLSVVTLLTVVGLVVGLPALMQAPEASAYAGQAATRPEQASPCDGEAAQTRALSLRDESGTQPQEGVSLVQSGQVVASTALAQGASANNKVAKQEPQTVIASLYQPADNDAAFVPTYDEASGPVVMQAASGDAKQGAARVNVAGAVASAPAMSRANAGVDVVGALSKVTGGMFTSLVNNVKPLPEVKTVPQSENAGSDVDLTSAGEEEPTVNAASDDDTPTEPSVIEGPASFEKAITLADGSTYEVRLAYEDGADIPVDTELVVREVRAYPEDATRNSYAPTSTEDFVSKEELSEEVATLSKVLKVTHGEDRYYYAQLLDVELMSGDEVVKPQPSGTLTLRTNAVELKDSDLLEVAHLGDEDARPLEVTNLSSEGEGVRLSMEVDRLGELGVMGVARSKLTWESHDEVINIQGPGSLDLSLSRLQAEGLEEGFEALAAFSVQVSSIPAYGTRLWVEVTPQDGFDAAHRPDEGIVGYRLEGGVVAGELFGTQGTESLELEPGEEIALAWDTGLREQTIELEGVTISGLMPKEARVGVRDVADQYAGLGQQLIDSEGETTVAAAYDVVLVDAAGDPWRPGEDDPLRVSLPVGEVGPEDELSVWRLGASGPARVENFDQANGRVTFEAADLGTYVVLRTAPAPEEDEGGEDDKPEEEADVDKDADASSNDKTDGKDGQASAIDQNGNKNDEEKDPNVESKDEESDKPAQEKAEGKEDAEESDEKDKADPEADKDAQAKDVDASKQEVDAEKVAEEKDADKIADSMSDDAKGESKDAEKDDSDKHAKDKTDKPSKNETTDENDVSNKQDAADADATDEKREDDKFKDGTREEGTEDESSTLVDLIADFAQTEAAAALGLSSNEASLADVSADAAASLGEGLDQLREVGERMSSKKGDAVPASDGMLRGGPKGSTVEGVAQVALQIVENAIVTVLTKDLVATDGRTYAITVTCGPDAGVPANVELEVYEILQADEGYETYIARAAEVLGAATDDLTFAKAFGIKLIEPDTGEEIQPTGDVRVSMRLLGKKLDKDTQVGVVHFGDTVDVMESTARGDMVSFDTDGFSVYVFAGVDAVPRCTFTFHVWSTDANGYTEYSFTDDQGESLTRQTVKNGNELVVPQLNSSDTEVFAGWYAGTSNGQGGITLEDSPYDFENVTITENSVVDLYAVYKSYVNVVFHDQYDNDTDTFPVAFTRRAELVTAGDGGTAVTTATVRISDLSATYTSSGGANMAFLGWSETPITTSGAEIDDNGNAVVQVITDEDGCITVTEDKHLYPIFKEVHWLTYYTAKSGSGADYVAPVKYFAGDAIPVPLPTTAMDGYTFLGWWTGTLRTEGNDETVDYGAQITNADGSLVASVDDGGVYINSGKLYLRSDATLYAKWAKSTTADYRIAIYTQNPSDADDLQDADKTYVFRENEQLNGTIGSSVSVRDEDKAKSYTGYTYARCDDPKVLAADGSTVLNVYYDKNSNYTPSGTYKLTFMDSAVEGASENLPKEYVNIPYGESIIDKIPANPTRRGYDFTKWYLDPSCTEQANLSTMPDHDLTVYAGWETGWYVVTIDPNYGALYAEEGGAGTGSTWFWSSYEGEPVGEYRQVTRDYVESSSGTWYYVNHSGDGTGGGNGWPDRKTYYTQYPSKATEDTTFEYAPGTYTYAGWYEVNADGTETPYTFGGHTDHNMTLRLHWKKTGTYYLAYAAGAGALDDGGANTLLLPDGYADSAGIVLTESAIAPSGYTFVGWQVRGSDSSMLYSPGQTFTLHAEDAQRVSGKDVVYLDAVFVRVGTASIVYNANGGTVAGGENFDFGSTYNSQNEAVSATGKIDADAGTATVSGITNNSRFKLSNGLFFTKAGFSLAGWSNKAVYDPNDSDAELYACDVDYVVDKEEPTTLYAVWETTVTYSLNETNATWGGTGGDGAWGAPYTYNSTENTHTLSAYLGASVSEPAFIPTYTGTENRLFRYWATKEGESYTQYDFSQPVTRALDLYAFWSAPATVAVHAVDASVETLAEKSSTDAGWTINNTITVQTTETPLTESSHVTAPEGYTFAFAAVSADLASVSEKNAVTAVKYDSKKKSVCVRYAGASDFTELEEGTAIWFVYYQDKTLTIGYKSMESTGMLSDVTSTGATQTSAALGSYTMAQQLSAPLSLVSGNTYPYYAFAIGSVDTHNDPQMNASNLSLLTDAAGVEDAVPVLRVRNTWRGFEYTTESHDNASWVSCGYDPYLYVIYYIQKPTTIIFREKTLGTSAVMDTQFTFNVKVEQTVTNGESETTSTLFDTSAEGNSPYTLKTDEERSAIVFFSATEDRSTTTQTITISQKENTDFTTSVSADSGTATQPNKWEYTSNGTAATQTVTFTNTHKSLPVTIHVAVVEHDGNNGGIIRRDDLRSTTEAHYTFDLSLGESEQLLDRVPSALAFAGDTNIYAFGSAMYGSGASNNGDAVTVGALGVVTVAYKSRGSNIYELVLKDGDGNILSELGDNDLYYLYYPMPKIRYVKEATDGTLTDITGCLKNTETGIIEQSDSVTYSHANLTMNGKTVVQNQSIEIPMSGFIISQNGNNFRMPPILDDGVSERYLSYTKLGAGAAGITSVSALGDHVSTSLSMQLKVQNNTLQYSFDGNIWQDLPLSGTPTIYAIYTERGYDLQISKTVNTSESGKNAIFSDSSYTVTIASSAITKASYEADGAESATIAATPASGENLGSITLTVQDGTRIRIKGLGRGDYTVTESGNENYTFTAKKGPIVGGTSSSVDVTDNTSISLTLDGETKLDLTNSPKAICKIGDHYFYTLRSMVEYVDTEIASKTAKVEMLTDYVMPAADTVEIPGGMNLTIETAEEGFSGAGSLAVITRTSALADVPLFTSGGNVTFKNMILDGNNVDGSAPLIRSEGDLTIDSGATIQNAINSSSGASAVFGGAINATAGNVKVNGTISGCSASNGGAIYYTGNGAISLSDQGKIENNVATTGDGGAICMTGGTLSLSGMSSMTGNKAEGGNGGAVYAGNALITVDQNAKLTNNTAIAGGAVYVESGTVTISNTEGYDDPPSITNNTATTGDGGAFWIGSGSVRVSGGNVLNNKAERGYGGAIYADSASVAVSDAAEFKINTAQSGGAIYAHTGAVTVSGGTLEGNISTSGSGGAICAQSGTVALSGLVSMKENHAESGNGGAVCAADIEVTLNQAAQIIDNEAGSGGAIYAASGTITLAASTVAEAEVSPAVSGNKAKTGNGGAIWLGSGSITVSGGSLSQNEAKGSGGAVYTEGASFTLTSAEGFTVPTVQGNKAINGSGGAVFSDSGMITISAGAIGGTGDGQGNTAGANGGVFYAGSGAVTIGAVNMSGNRATGKGGAAYVGSGTAELNSVTMTGNTAANGAAIFVDTGRASFSAGSYTNNVAMAGGAVGMGSTDARLTFSGNAQIKDNKLGTEDGAPKSNVYLDQDSSDVLNFTGLGSSASMGIYVPDALTEKRDVPGARFGSYIDNANTNKITNDRYSSLTVQSDTSAKKLYWGNAIKVSVCYMSSFSGGFPPSTTPDSIRYYKTDSYYPEFNDAAISELAAELFTKYGSNYKLNNTPMSATAVYAGAYLDGDSQFGDYLTKLTWDTPTSQWLVTRRDGSTTPLPHSNGLHRIYIYYAEPAYINIENNTNMALKISDMKVNGTSVINSDTVAGYGMVFAKNGAIRSALLPVSESDLSLAANQAVTLLIPGGRNMNFSLEGSFTTSESGNVRLRCTGKTESMLSYRSDGTFDALTGTTLGGPGTYSIVFGDDKVICKVVDAGGVEHPYSKIGDAIAAIVNTTGSNPPYTLQEEKKATIEMVIDYLLTASDVVEIPNGYDITLTTASKDSGTYRYAGEGTRATISRDSENTGSMISGWNSKVNNKVVTTLRLNNLIFDGKSVRGSSDGGAVATQFTNVYIDSVDFKNVYASNGGALLVMFEFNKNNTKENKATLQGTVLEVKNSQFTGCTSTTTVTSNRLGGGAIVTNAATMTLENCIFRNCTAVDQAGAVFHRVDGNYNSWTNVTGCTFSNCQARAAGGLELDSKTINVSDTVFEHCVATERNGGGFNVWPLNSGTTDKDCSVTVKGCTFNDCQVTDTKSNGGNGGGFRCAALYTKVENCTFTDNKGYYGGGFCVSNSNAKKTEIYGSSFERNTANQGGGILVKATEVIVGDYTYTDDEGVEQVRHTEIINCTSNQEGGGGIRHDKNSTGSSLTITNAVISGNESKASSKDGGGVFTNAHTVTIDGATISGNRTTRYGGGLYSNAAISLTFTDTIISGNASTSNNGGGVYYAPATDTVPLTVNSCTIVNNTAANGNGGGIWTSAGRVTIGKADGYANGTVISSCTAKNGGGVFQDKNTSNAFLTLTDATVTDCRATNGIGGGIRTNAWTVTLNGATVSHNSATSNGGGIWYDGANDDNRKLMSLTVNGSTIDGNTSGGNGGGIYTLVKNVSVSSLYTVSVGEESVNKAVSISNNTAASNGGGIYHSRNVDGSSLTVTGGEAYPVTISGNNASSGEGGGVYANVRSTGFAWTEVSGNKAGSSGGGIYDPMDGETYTMTLDHTSATSNTSGNQGGGIYTRTQLYLKNNSMVTGNRLTGGTVDNAAGVYLLNGRTVYVGTEGATEADSSSVKENYTASGAASNLRLWWDSTNKQNATGSVWVYCDLNGYIGVVNAAKVGTQFGTSSKANPAGFSDDNPVFKADTSTLHGIIDRTDTTGKKIIWAGPPVAKITDGDGNLLYLKTSTEDSGNTVGTSPAIFDRLYEGAEDLASIVGAFNVLNSNNLGLNPEDSGFDSSQPMLYNADGSPYIGTEFCVKMLVETYASDSQIFVKGVEGRTITLTTAGTTDSQYPSEAKRATVKAGGVSKSLLNPRGNLVLKNIVIDGSEKVRTMWYQPKVNSTVTLGESAVIQNGKANNDHGGGIRIKQTNNTAPVPTFEIKGGVIRSCESTGDGKCGGAIYLESGTLNFEAGNITDCTATGSGGGVFLNSGTFNMTGGTISGCSAKKGGGVLVPNNASAPFNMSGGSIVNNTATETGGGIAVSGANSRINFSKKVTVSGNKATKEGAQVACNVELDQDSNMVINTNNGGLYGGSYIGVYVTGRRVDDNKNNNANGDPFKSHGTERAPFGTFAEGDSTTNLYSFVNDRNGFKGGIIEDPLPNTIYWIKIFSLQVSKTVKAGESTSVDPDEPFLFKVSVRGTPSVSGQPRPEQIDSETGSYGDMEFTSNGIDTTTAVFELKDDESVTTVNISEGLDYEIIEYLIVFGGDNYPYNNQHIRYAAMPMNGYSGTPESLEYNGTTYTVIKANSYSSRIGENKNRKDVDPYTSVVPFTNLMPVCKITDDKGNLLYQKYTWEKVTSKPGEQEYYFAPAVYTELTGADGAFKVLENGTLYRSNDANPPSYSVRDGIQNSVQIQMLTGSYAQTEGVTLPSTVTGKVTLTTASASDALFPKQDGGTTSTILRSGFTDASMFIVGGDLTLENIILDGAKGSYTTVAEGGIANVPSGGKLSIKSGATLQNSKTSSKGGAVYVDAGGTLTMTGGTINKNESEDKGAGVYLAEGSIMNLSGNPNFGGNGLNQAGNITEANGNWKNEVLTGKLNGGKLYSKPRQDIFIAGYASTNDEDTSAASLVVTGDITSGDGTIWVWAEESPRYKCSGQFAIIDQNAEVSIESLHAFRNAQPDDVTLNKSRNYFLYGVTTDSSNVIWRPQKEIKEVWVYEYEKGTLAQAEAGVPKFKGIYYFDSDQYIYVEKSLDSLNDSNGDYIIDKAIDEQGNHFVKSEDYKYGTSMIDGIIEVVSVRADGGYMVKDNEKEQSGDLNDVLKVFYYKTDDLVPLVVRKTWNAPESVINSYSGGVGFTIKDADGNVLDAYADDSASSDKVTKITSADATSTDSHTWEKLVYVPKSNRYSIIETESGVVIHESSDYSYHQESANNNKSWVLVPQANWGRAYLQIECAKAKEQYDNIDGVSVVFRDVDGVYYRSQAEFSPTKLSETGKTFYIEIPMPKLGDNAAVLLVESNSHGYYTQDGLSGEYGLRFYAGGTNKGAPRFSYAKQLDDPNGNIHPIAFSKVAILDEVPSGRPENSKILAAIDSTKQLEVFTRRTLGMTNNAICKIVKDDNEYVFGSLHAALTWARTNMIDESGNVTATIEMLIDYTISESDTLKGDYAIKSKEAITLTTASTGTYQYEKASTQKAILTRRATGDSLIKVDGGALSLTDITFDGGSTLSKPLSCSGNGGIANVTSGTLSVGSGTILRNSQATNGGAVYVGSNGRMTVGAGATISNNMATTAGAGIYLQQDGILELSGSPNFGGTGTTAQGEIYYFTSTTATNGKTVYRRCYKDSAGATQYPDQDTSANKDDYYLWEEGNLYRVNSDATKYLDDTIDGDGNPVHHAVSGNVIPGIGNFLVGSLTGEENGGMPYAQIREDIHIAGYQGESSNATSLVITGKLTKSSGTDSMDCGSIWVGAQHDAHYKQSMQFATFGGDAVGTDDKVKSEVDAENTMMAFRNAYSDAKTENGIGSFLYGEAGDGLYINWSGVKGSARVILKKVRKVDAENVPLGGAELTVYKKDQTTIAKGNLPDGSTEGELKDKTSGDSGVFWIGDLPYGTYYLHEIKPVEKWFYFVLDENFQIMSEGFDNQAAAKAAGDAESTAVSWASKVIGDKRSFSDVPAEYQDEVRKLLTDSGHGDKVPST